MTHEKVTFIINGTDVEVTVPAGAMLRDAVARALEISHSSPHRSWHVRDNRGITLPQDQPVGRFHFGDERLFLMPDIGAGGS